MQPTGLRGADHEQLGEIATLAEGSAAIALSRGGARKTYRHRHVNEDAVGFLHAQGGSLALVADGHGGREAAELALAWVLEDLAPRWLAAGCPLARDFEREARAAARALNAHILRASLGAASQPCRTTLSLALLRPGDDWFGHWSVGDSHVFEIAGRRVREPCALPRDGLAFLGDASTESAALERRVRIGAGVLSDVSCLVLASDGLSESGIGVPDPVAAVAELVAAASGHPPALRPLALARGVVERALAAQRAQRSGDNVAAAVLWPAGADDRGTGDPPA